ncbi:LAME_0G12662g1_1 [Lachancea meyersii CBS 8951]|uniref:LAME_0G12662g1_1 n=1 Tax=Lachancea meyersii CBS 8951 TaxID=1266667 RepID=A0A1G4K9Y0_9SACH|nr:LAME_0G12662g1_1 [Lachancea meyersii CBS 8951]
MSLNQDALQDSQIDDAYVVVGSPSSEKSDLGDFEQVDPSDDDDELESLGDEPYYEMAVREIARGDSYQCMICTVEMDYTCHMYNCPKCYRVFDYECIREWALKSSKKSASNTWKCPNCYFEKREIPLNNRHSCWCGKSVNPEPNPLNPNSCGQTCDAPVCVHGCAKTCHLGPHPTCMRTVKIKCLCGKQSKDVFCSEAPKNQESFRCKKRCGLLLPCGLHTCQRECHSGLCGDCPETINCEVKCYCGLESKASVACKDVMIQAKSHDHSGKEWIGVFPCKKVRTVEYACGAHSFTEPCQSPPSLGSRIPCPFSPTSLKTCPCGRNPLKDLNSKRTSCTDPIPTCESICGKLLKCGKHRCPFQCHTGECMQDCTCVDKIPCSCNAKTFLVPCKFENKPQCNTKCESLMSCRRHRCMERCCEGRELARKREKSTFLTRDKLDESRVEAQHICLKQCNLKLACGRHYCQRKCHPGSCPPCLESDSNDLLCPCGKTVVPAPVRCGTTLPRCFHPCIKTLQGPLECGHPPMPHYCHPLNEPCPSCTAPVFKRCKCGKNEKVRTLCFQDDVSCGQICGQKLPNCHHICQKTCHEEGQHQTECKQVCGAPKGFCEHSCRYRCHPGRSCPDKPCTENVKVKCICGHRTANRVCGAHSEQASASEHVLDCNEECEIAQRRMDLMEAFGIQEKGVEASERLESLRHLAETVLTFQELHLPFTEASLSIFARQSNWCSQIETTLIKLMQDKQRPSLHFKPMKPAQRHFIHELAQAFNLYCESQDQEPKRSCFVKKTATSAGPTLSLAEALPLYQSFRAAQKNRKLKEIERSITTKIINFTAGQEENPAPLAKLNGLLVRGVFSGVDEGTIATRMHQFLKHTLLKDSRYTKLESGDILICAENYAKASPNVEFDIQRVIGHLNVFVQEEVLAENVVSCEVSQVLEFQRVSSGPSEKK